MNIPEIRRNLQQEKRILEEMRQRTQSLVDDAKKAQTIKVKTPKVQTSEGYHVIAFPIREPMKAGTKRRPQRELQEMMLIN